MRDELLDPDAAADDLMLELSDEGGLRPRQLADFVECLDRDAIAILGIQSRDGRVHPSLKALLEIPACEVLTPMSGQPNRSEPRWHLASVTGWLHLELAASHLVLLETPTDIDLEMFHWELAHR